MFRILTLTLVLFSFALDVEADTNCAETLSRELPRLIELPAEEFDQAPNGWRLLSKDGCFDEAAQAIDSFAKTNPAPYNVYFHGAQMHATIGNYARARELLKAAIRPEMPDDSPFRWNAYVQAVDAFLAGDLVRLNLQRALISERTDVRGNKINLAVVERLISEFGKPYGEIFK